MKERVLKLLKDNKDEFISGQKISEELDVTRTAIWKHIKSLKDDGYEIESISRKGYRLVASPDLLTRQEVKEILATKIIGKNIFYFDSIDSTNMKAKELAREGATEGSVVISEEQTNGRGRLGREWISPKGKGIWMSIILRPDIDPIDASKITQIGAAAVWSGIKDMGIKTKIKWPNDIVHNGKKLCGILTEMSGELNKLNYIIIGIGINVNIEEEEFSDDIKNIATSLKIEEGKYISRKELVANILERFEEYYKELYEDGTVSKAIEICRKESILIGKDIKIISRGNETFAKAIDLNNDGELIIEEDGNVRTLISGEVSVRGVYGYV